MHTWLTGPHHARVCGQADQKMQRRVSCVCKAAAVKKEVTSDTRVGFEGVVVGPAGARNDARHEAQAMRHAKHILERTEAQIRNGLARQLVRLRGQKAGAPGFVMEQC